MDVRLLRRSRLPFWMVPAAMIGLTAGLAQSAPSLLETDERPQPFVAKHLPSEADADHCEALALFATGRTFEQRQELDTALRFYERASRCDPTAPAILEAIVSVAAVQKRYDVAARYAAKAVAIDEVRPSLLRRVGIYLTDAGDFPGAIALYEKILTGDSLDQEDAVDILLRTELGRLYNLAGQHKRAADQFARVIDAMNHPDKYGLTDEVKSALLSEPGPTYNLFGESFLLADRLAEATAAFEKSHALAPNEALLQYHRAQIAARSDKPDQALAALQSAFEKHLAPQDLGPYELLAELLKKLGKEKELIGSLEKLHIAVPECVPLSYFLAGQYRQAGQLDKAERLYLALLKLAPSLTAYRSLAEIYCAGRRADSLLPILGEAMEKTGTLEVFGKDAGVLAAKAEVLDSLVESARRMLKARPDDLDSNERLALAILAADRKQYDRAAEFFELALQAQPKQAAEILLTWGTGLLLDERPAEAVKVLERGIDQQSQNKSTFYFYLAAALTMVDRNNDALAAAEKAVEIQKDSARIYSRIPTILYHAKRYDEAIREYTKLIAKFDGEHQSAETRGVLRASRLSLSNLCVLTKQFPAAEEWLEQVLDEYPDDVSASNDLGYLWIDQGKHLHRALGMVQKAVAAEPDNLAYRDSLGWAYYRLGRFEEAVVELGKATADKAPDATVLGHLGDACLRAGHPDRAKDAWRRAAEAFRKDKDIEKVKEMETRLGK